MGHPGQGTAEVGQFDLLTLLIDHAAHAIGTEQAAHATTIPQCDDTGVKHEVLIYTLSTLVNSSQKRATVQYTVLTRGLPAENA